MSDIDLIIERLEVRGHRITGSRRRVLDAVLAQPAHFTVDDVLRSTRRVGRATVFRTMKLLLDLNIVAEYCSMAARCTTASAHAATTTTWSAVTAAASRTSRTAT